MLYPHPSLKLLVFTAFPSRSRIPRLQIQRLYVVSVAAATRFNCDTLTCCDVSGSSSTSYGANVSFSVSIFMHFLALCKPNLFFSNFAGLRRCHQRDGRASRVVVHRNRPFQRIMRRHNM